MIGRIGIACMALLAATSARAQSPASDTALAAAPSIAAPTAVAQPRLGPTLEGGIVGAHHVTTLAAFDAPRAAADGPHVGRDQALMIVGGAGVVVGAIIGSTPGTLLMVGGAIAGLYGLYEYLQ